MNIKIRLLLAFCIVLISSSRASSDISWESHVLLVGQPKRVTPVVDSERNEVGLVGSWFEVEFKNIRVIGGSLEVSDIDLEVFASHKEALSSEKEIYLLVDAKGEDKIKVLHWGVPRVIACIPKVLIEGSVVERSFNIKSGYEHELCTNAEWHQ